MKIFVRALIKTLAKIGEWAKEEGEDTIYGAGAETADAQEGIESEELHSIWDHLAFKENTQADHLQGAIGFEEWVEMEEIRRRVAELFGARYKNDRSLYPYIKTLVDAGLFETTSAGGRRRWRKKDLLIRLGREQEGGKDAAGGGAGGKDKKIAAALREQSKKRVG